MKVSSSPCTSPGSSGSSLLRKVGDLWRRKNNMCDKYGWYMMTLWFMCDIIYIWFYGWSSWDNYHGPWISSSWMILNYMDDIWVMVHSDHSRQRCGRASGAVTVFWRCNCLGECFMWLTRKVDTVCDTVFVLHGWLVTSLHTFQFPFWKVSAGILKFQDLKFEASETACP